MNRRTFLAACASAPTLAALLAACGEDTTTGGIGYPQGANDAVLRLGYRGGFVAPGTDFINLPTLLISGDGRVFAPGAQTMEYPGPLLPAISVRTITPAGIRRVVQLAVDAGLLAPPPDYTLPEGIGIADAPDTVLIINANGATFEHVAPALGMVAGAGGTETPARERLNRFVTLLADLAKVAGSGNLGTDEVLVPTSYRFVANPVDPTQFTDPSPTIVDWPADSGVVLVDSAQCAVVTAEKIGDLFTRATQLTFFLEGEQAYQLSAVAMLPGDPVC